MDQGTQNKSDAELKSKRELTRLRKIVAFSILLIGLWGLLYLLFWFESETYSYKFGEMTRLKKNIFRIICYDVAIGCILAGTYFGFFHDDEIQK